MSNKITKDQEIINLKNAILGYQSGVSLLRETLEKTKSWLKEEIENTELNDEKLCESNDDFIHYGRQECADGLLTQIKKWEEEHGV